MIDFDAGTYDLEAFDFVKPYLTKLRSKFELNKFLHFVFQQNKLNVTLAANHQPY